MTDTDTAIECISDSVLACIGNTPLVMLNRLFPQPGVEVLAKLEFMNPGGSMKDRPARYIIEKGLADGSIPPGAHLVESSSGNFGIALAVAARLHGMTFTCVVDPKITSTNIAILHQLGADVDIVDQPDDGGGYLQTRLRRVQELLQEFPAAVWVTSMPTTATGRPTTTAPERRFPTNSCVPPTTCSRRPVPRAASWAAPAVCVSASLSCVSLPSTPPDRSIFPDRGNRYLDLMYDDEWLAGLRRRELDVTDRRVDKENRCPSHSSAPRQKLHAFFT